MNNYQGYYYIYYNFDLPSLSVTVSNWVTATVTLIQYE